MAKRFGSNVAVDSVTLTIGEGEFFSLLGPSGCGKTTTLRMIAGFEAPSEGRILLQGVDVTTVLPNRRNVNMVFQHYALFPHMSVYDNVAFGLKVKRVPRDLHRGRIEEMLRVVDLVGLERRRTRQLSGGQQQRVALARALVNLPAALLLDEPLGALDVKLRKHMQLELKRIQADLGTTFVYVTHDQEEALAMSDRIAVMNGGRVEQIGSPRDIYQHPQTAFVADFIGSLNALELTVGELVGGYALTRFGEGSGSSPPWRQAWRPATPCVLRVRPERVQLGPLDGAVSRAVRASRERSRKSSTSGCTTSTTSKRPRAVCSATGSRSRRLRRSNRPASPFHGTRTTRRSLRLGLDHHAALRRRAARPRRRRR